MCEVASPGIDLDLIAHTIAVEVVAARRRKDLAMERVRERMDDERERRAASSQ